VIGWIGERGEEIPVGHDSPAPGLSATPVEQRKHVELAASTSPAGRVLAAPAVRALAREHGLDISRIQGAGPGGRVDREDVLAAIAQLAPDGEPVPAHRQAIAARLTRAAAVPQFSLATTVDLTRALSDLEGSAGGTVTHLLLRAVASALRLHPDLNRIWVDEGPRLHTVEPIRVGLAVAAEDRLVVPTVAEPDMEPLEALVRRVRLLVSDARAGRIAAEHAGVAAVTVSNLGMFGVDWFQAIVDPDQAAILAAGAINRRPVVTDDGIAAVSQIELVLSVDHRVADGATAARFLQTLKAELE
jgi:pyruvate dehydrogenase E2 component (dihydrolipoamide acetyltransferase)